MAFEGFSKETLRFLVDLRRHNNRGWFQKNRKRYEEDLLQPAMEYVVAMGRLFPSLSPDINAEPRINKAIRRINRDTRFSKDKTPYKDHLDFHFVHGEQKCGVGYFLRITPDVICVGTGVHHFDRDQLVRYREAVIDQERGKALARVLKKIGEEGFQVGREHYKRVPRGFDPDHERADLLRYDALYALLELPIPGEFFSSAFAGYSFGHYRRLSPLTEWLVKL
jgi:uncharacterized protein (TIGR02453 family)